MPTDSLLKMRISWPKWVEFLRNHRMEGLVAWALDVAGPLTILGAQALYLSDPLLRPVFSNRQIGELANLLEESSEVQAFVAFLREERA
jgi:hypothetical protein